MSDKLASARASSVAAAYHRVANASASGLGVSEVHEEPDHDDSRITVDRGCHHMDPVKESLNIESPCRDQWNSREPDPDDHSGYQNKFEPDPDDSPDGKALEPESYINSEMVQQVLPLKIGKQLTAANSYEEPDPDDSKASQNSAVVVELGSFCSHVMEVDCTVQPRNIIAEPDPDDSEAEQKANIVRLNHDRSVENETMKDESHLYVTQKEPDPDESHANRVMMEEPDPDDNLVQPPAITGMKIDEPDPDDQELRRIQDSVAVVCSRLQKAIEMLRAEVNHVEATSVLQTLFKIIRYVCLGDLTVLHLPPF